MMINNDSPQRFEWLDKPVLERLENGVPLVIFGAENHFENSNFKSAAVSAQFKELRENIKNLAITRLQLLDKIDPMEQLKRIENLAKDVRNKRPRVFFIDEKYSSLVNRSCKALDGIDQIRRLILSDKLISRVLRDAMQIDLSTSKNIYVSPDLPPLTPIEEVLLNEMTKQGLEVSCQVKLTPFVADFIVTLASNRFVVEADGAAFHDPEKDAMRDRQILNEYGIPTIRFSGAEILSNPKSCVDHIQNSATRNKNNAPTFNYEGIELLDSSQREAVDHFGRDARILAPAGSGKTKVLVNHVIKLLNSGALPSGILVLAFNRKASLQLEDRLSSLGIPVGKGRENKNGVWVATLNSFGFRVLREEGNTSKLLDASWKEKALVEEVVGQTGQSLIPMRGEDPMATITREIARIRRGLRSPQGVEIEFPQPSDTATIQLEPIWQRVREEQSLSNVITFDDQIFLAADLLLNEPILRHDWQSRFTHVLVDEYQDLNPAQILLLQIVTAGRASIFAVGDDDQVIYSWRDASVVNLLENFEHSYPGMKTFALNTNYRCPKPIVRTSQRLIKKNKRRFPKNIKPAEIAPEGSITISRAEGLLQLGDKLTDFFFENKKKSGDEWREMAVLTRTKVQLLAAALALDKAGIPRTPLPQVRLFSTPAAKRLTAYISVVCSFASDCPGQDIAYIVNQPNRFVRNVDVEKLKNVYDPWTLVNIIAYGCPNKTQPNEELKSFLKDITEIMLMTRDQVSTATDIIDAILSRFKISIKPDEAMHSADDATDEILLHLIRETSRNHLYISDFLEFLTASAADEISDEKEKNPTDVSEESEEERRDQVTLSTIHGSKGREWPTVCIFDTSRVSTPKTKESEVDDEEERRIFYVGMTRSMKSLNFSYVAEKAHPYIGEAMLPPELIGKEKADSNSWLAKTSQKLEAKMRLLADKTSANENLDEEISNLISGRKIIDLEQKKKEREDARNQLQSQMNNLNETKPDSIFVRLFRGGKTGGMISRAIEAIRERLSSLDDQIEQLGTQLQWEKNNTEEMLEKLRQQKTKFEHELLVINSDASALKGAIDDVEIAKDHMPLG